MRSNTQYARAERQIEGAEPQQTEAVESCSPWKEEEKLIDSLAK